MQATFCGMEQRPNAEDVRVVREAIAYHRDGDGILTVDSLSTSLYVERWVVLWTVEQYPHLGQRVQVETRRLQHRPTAAEMVADGVLTDPEGAVQAISRRYGVHVNTARQWEREARVEAERQERERRTGQTGQHELTFPPPRRQELRLAERRKQKWVALIGPFALAVPVQGGRKKQKSRNRRRSSRLLQITLEL